MNGAGEGHDVHPCLAILNTLAKMGVSVYADAVFSPLSVFITVGYHVFLWHNFKHKPSHTSIGMDALRRKVWFQEMKEGDDKKGMLVVQSMRNMFMVTILTASLSILINLSLAALTNNAYNASNLFTSEIMGSQNARAFVVKYGSTSLFLTGSFVCSSLAIGFLVDASFLINACVGDDDEDGFGEYTRWVMERGFVVALIGNRMLCVACPLLLWMFGPLPAVSSSIGLVWVLYEFDFGPKLKSSRLKINRINTYPHPI